MTNERAIELLNRISDSQFDGPHGDTRREALEMAVKALFSQQIVNDSQGLVNDCISRKAVMKEFSDFVRKSNNSDFAQTPTWNDAVSLVGSIPSAQPELLEHEAYIRGFEQGRTQGMIDEQERKKMNRQRKILITVIYNDLGIIVDTKAEELDLSANLQSTSTDCISRQQAIDAFEPEHDTDWYTPTIIEVLEALPPVQPTQTNADSTQSNTLDCVSRRAAIDAIRKIYDSVGILGEKWAVDKCQMAIKDLPPAQPQRKMGKWISEVKGKKAIIDENGNVTCSAHCSECGDWLTGSDEYACRGRFCPNCGARIEGESE